MVVSKRRFSWLRTDCANAEVRLADESQLRDLAISLAQEVGTGQAAVYQQYEIGRNEQAAQTCRMNRIIVDVGAHRRMVLDETTTTGDTWLTVGVGWSCSGDVSSAYLTVRL